MYGKSLSIDKTVAHKKQKVTNKISTVMTVLDGNSQETQTGRGQRAKRGGAGDRRA